MSRRPRRAAPAPSRRMLLGLGSGLKTFLVIVLAVLVAAIGFYIAPGPKTADGKDRTVVLRKGAGVQEIASTLATGDAIHSAAVFMAAAELTGAAPKLKAGEYAFPSGASMASVLGQVRAGRVVRHFFTVPEGLPSVMISDALAADPALTGDAPTPPEGAVLPDTYEYLLGEDRATLLQRMMSAQTVLLQQLWDARKPGLPIDTPQDAVTLASIVEKETSLPAERPHIASVFINRLRAGMPLASDPTIIYAITQGRPLGRGLRESELQMDSPYNSYKNPGLPPTPITNPGRASLAAVLNPPDTSDLYFVANGTGGHSFAATLAEHEKNVAKWRAIEAGQSK